MASFLFCDTRQIESLASFPDDRRPAGSAGDKDDRQTDLVNGLGSAYVVHYQTQSLVH